MAHKEEFLQVWDYILDNDELDVTDVLLLSKVISLHATKDGCYMSNDYICTMLRLKNIETASRRINKLEKMGYVELKYIPLPTNAKKTRRFIVPTYQKGLMLKSSRVDLKVNIPLITKSIPLDLKVNTPLTTKSTTPCLESQSIISVEYINENIREIHQLEHINQLDKENPVELNDYEKEQLLNLIKTINAPDDTSYWVECLIKNEDIVNSRKEQIRKHKHFFNKGTLLPKVIEQRLAH
jgi:hypothetical protein